LKKLNASARNCRRKRSRKVKVLSNDRSTLLRPSPRVRGRLRPALPKEFRPAHQFRSPVLTEPHPDAHGSVESMCHGAATARGSGFHHGPLAAGGGAGTTRHRHRERTRSVRAAGAQVPGSCPYYRRVAGIAVGRGKVSRKDSSSRMATARAMSSRHGGAVKSLTRDELS